MHCSVFFPWHVALLPSPPLYLFLSPPPSEYTDFALLWFLSVQSFFFIGDRWQIRAKEAKKNKSDITFSQSSLKTTDSGWFVGKSVRINAWYHFHFIVHSPPHDQRGRIYMKLYYTSQMFIIIIIIITISCQIIIIFRNFLDAPCIFTEELKMTNGTDENIKAEVAWAGFPKLEDRKLGTN